VVLRKPDGLRRGWTQFPAVDGWLPPIGPGHARVGHLLTSPSHCILPQFHLWCYRENTRAASKVIEIEILPIREAFQEPDMERAVSRLLSFHVEDEEVSSSSFFRCKRWTIFSRLWQCASPECGSAAAVPWSIRELRMLQTSCQNSEYLIILPRVFSCVSSGVHTKPATARCSWRSSNRAAGIWTLCRKCGHERVFLPPRCHRHCRFADPATRRWSPESLDRLSDEPKSI
jgi:hypothetical protein